MWSKIDACDQKSMPKSTPKKLEKSMQKYRGHIYDFAILELLLDYVESSVFFR